MIEYNRYLNYPGKRVRNKRKERIKRKSDNPLVKLTGNEVHILTGKNAPDCHLCFTQEHKRVRIYKLAYALANGWQRYEMSHTSRRMKQLTVRRTCGINECVNPDHLIGEEKPISILDTFK